MKRKLANNFPDRENRNRTWLMMSFTFILFFGLCLSVSAKDFHVNGTKVLHNSYISQSQQKIIVTGKVIDSQNNPMVGATVSVKGAVIGTTVGPDGRYELSVPNHDAILVFSFIGYQHAEIQVKGRTKINMTLIESVESLDVVVVVGYGKQKKETVTGAISTITTKDLLQSPQANISNALVGRLPGLFAVQNGGEPGKDQSTLRIRGVGTFSGSQDPLVMVDGIETSNYNNIDPNEIENVSILKDASATAVYGVRGANGVLLITTKRGKEGEPTVSFSSNYAISEFTELPKNMNSYDYARHYNEARKYDSYLTGSYTPRFSDGEIELYRTGEDPIFYPSIDWYDELLKPTSSQTQHNLSINGGTKRVKYFISAGYFNQEGLFKNTDLIEQYDAQINFKRYNFRSNFDFEITKRMTANINIAYQIEDKRGLASDVGAFLGSVGSANPLSYPGIIDGKIITLANSGVAYNPYVFLYRSGYNRQYNNYLNSSVRFNYLLDFITEGLSAHGTVSYQNFNGQNAGYNTNLVSYVALKQSDGSSVFVPQGVQEPFYYTENIGKNRKIYSEVGLDYSRKFGNHNVTGLFLYNQSKYYDPGLAFLIPNGYQGIVGRTTYDYKSRYLLEFNMGYNGTENFAKGKRFGFFPAYSVGWVVSEEPFFPKNNIVSFLKIRVSSGEVGNDKIGGQRFLYTPSQYVYSDGSNYRNFDGNSIPYGYYFGEVGSSYNFYQASREGKIGNPLLTWERAKKRDIGIEFRAWKDKISVSADYFDENRDNILAYRGSTPIISGADLPAYNFGEMRNRGFDGDITYNEMIGTFHLWIKANYTYAHNVVEFQDEVERPFTYQNRTGQRFGQYFGLIAEGLYNSWEEVNDPQRPQSVWNNNRIQPGDIKYKDVNGDGIINQDDEVPIGYSNFPEKVFGISFGWQFKGFDFSMLFQGAANVSYIYTGDFQSSFASSGAKSYFESSWSQERYDQGLPINFPHFSESVNNLHNMQNSSFWVRDASYLRLKNAEIGYTFPGRLLSKLKISSLRIYTNGNNLYTWSNMFPGIDPESAPLAHSYAQYPLTATFNMGLNVKF